MTKRKRATDGKVRYRIKRFQDAFSDYENTVTFISSLEAWFTFRWGDEGQEIPGLLLKFDRFPELGSLTPDFAVYFRRPYVVVGEYLKTFRKGRQGLKDVDQLVAYSRCVPSPGQPQVAHDVLVFTDIFSDDVAAVQMEQAWARDKNSRPGVPVVILGYTRDTERASGQWYKCKWRKHAGNRRFSTPNISDDPKTADLNKVLVSPTHHAIPVDRHALDFTRRNPLVNDKPPALYTLVRLVYPALFHLLDDDERDRLQADQRITKTVTRDGMDPCKYAVMIDIKEFSKRDWKDFFSERAARALVRKLKSSSRRPRRSSVDAKQLKLW